MCVCARGGKLLEDSSVKEKTWHFLGDVAIEIKYSRIIHSRIKLYFDNNPNILFSVSSIY